MFLSLADLSQISTAAQGFSFEAQVRALQPLADTRNWKAIVTTLDPIQKTAQASGSVPIMVKIKLLNDKLVSNDVNGAVLAIQALVTVAHKEDTATIEDRIRNEDLISKQIDQLAIDIKKWTDDRSGVYGAGRVLWERIRGGADTTALLDEAKEIKEAVDTTVLTPEGRDRLNKRLPQVVATIKPGDWRYVAAIAVGGLLWSAAKAKAAALAQEKAAATARALHERIKRRKK